LAARTAAPSHGEQYQCKHKLLLVIAVVDYCICLMSRGHQSCAKRTSSKQCQHIPMPPAEKQDTCRNALPEHSWACHTRPVLQRYGTRPQMHAIQLAATHATQLHTLHSCSCCRSPARCPACVPASPASAGRRPAACQTGGALAGSCGSKKGPTAGSNTQAHSSETTSRSIVPSKQEGQARSCGSE
jgi:hypothetical protein